MQADTTATRGVWRNRQRPAERKARNGFFMHIISKNWYDSVYWSDCCHVLLVYCAAMLEPSQYTGLLLHTKLLLFGCV
jgi:hypothetical protein